MKVEKIQSKAKTTSRKAVTQAIAHQDKEQNFASLKAQDIQQAIQFKAYELYEQRGYTNGDAMEDWLTAERIILQNFR